MEPEVDPERDQRTVFAYQVLGMQNIDFSHCLIASRGILSLFVTISVDHFEGW